MDISRLARENELMKDYIHVNEILIDMILENRRAMAILNHYVPTKTSFLSFLTVTHFSLPSHSIA
jgi:hypothetical protein